MQQKHSHKKQDTPNKNKTNKTNQTQSTNKTQWEPHENTNRQKHKDAHK